PGPLSSLTGVARPYMPPSSLMRGLETGVTRR
ncbi:uncharacterized, partial [Tachysurus ichikawai]